MAETEMPDAPTPATSSSGMAKRAPGEPSAFADLRGGPGNYGGTNYQALYAVLQIVDWLQVHWDDPTAVGYARCEARIVQTIPDDSPDAELRVGQHGFDVAVTGISGTAPDYREVKRTPTKAEAIELLASLRHLPAATDGHPAPQVGLVADSATRDYQRIERLYRLAGEATNDKELTALVAASNDDALVELLDAVGSADAPGRRQLMLDRMVAPIQWSSTQLKAHVVQSTNLLAGTSAGEQLLNTLLRKVVDASQARQAISLADLRQALVEGGLMHGSPAAVPTADPENEDLYRLLVVLETCPVPVPKGLLAEALGKEIHQLEGQYSEAVTSGLIQEAGGAWSRTAMPGGNLSTAFGHPLHRAVLAGLLNLAEMGGSAATGQTLNALALSEACFNTDRDTVARIFQAFDKPSKAWGDLSVVLSLAQLSMAALDELRKVTKVATLVEDYAQIAAQTWICGHGWVYQRVDEHSQARYYMSEAQKLAEFYNDDENQAFTLKCQGRLYRLEAELTTDDALRAELLAKSEQMLRDAVQAFDELDIANVRKKEENHGESKSLLARTLATQEKLDEARQAIELAEDLLTGYRNGKAYGDLAVLRAEIFHITTDKGGEPETRAAHLEALNGLLERHDRGLHTPGAGSDRSASELSARLHRTVGLLHEHLETEVAAAGYRRAADVYEAMDYTPGRESALWEARVISGTVIPEGLKTALTKVSASPGVCLRAVDHAAKLSTSATDGDTMAGSDAGSDTNWDHVVHLAQKAQAAATPRWGPGKASA